MHVYSAVVWKRWHVINIKVPLPILIVDMWIMNIHLWSKANISNAKCAWATTSIFDSRKSVLVKMSMIMRQKLSRPEGGFEPPALGFLLNALTIWAIRAIHLLSHVFEYSLCYGGIEVNIAFFMLRGLWVLAPSNLSILRKNDTPKSQWSPVVWFCNRKFFLLFD